jgi:toxin ParE1/3/4
MALRIVIWPEANREIDAQAEYLYRQASLVVAERFARALQDTLERIADMPGVGSPFQFEDVQLAGVRTWLVRGFRSHVIYYRADEERLDVIHVLHGAQNAESLFVDF